MINSSLNLSIRDKLSTELE